MPAGTPVSPDSEARAIIDDELAILDRVRGAVQRRGSAARGEADVDSSDFDKELVALRDQMAEEREEDLPVLVEHMTRLAALAQNRRPKAAAPVDLGTPYFAHMRIVAKDADGPLDILIGKRGLIDRAANVQIVDWRDAPVSQVYYRYDEGDDYEEEVSSTAPSGRASTSELRGHVLLRRNVSIAGGRLRRIGCPQGSFVSSAGGAWYELTGQDVPLLQGGQGTAIRPPRATGGSEQSKKKQRRMEAARPTRADTKVLPEIASLIDPDQFALITAPSSGLVIIQGGAGSGKTTVALHRIAYLVFHDKAVRPNRCLFVVPKDALGRYVAGVLPSLGVEGVPVVTFASWARTLRRRLLPDLPDQYSDDTPPSVVRCKKHPHMERLLRAVAAREVKSARERLASRLAGLDGGDAVLRGWDERADVAPVSRARRLRSVVEKGKIAVPRPTAHIADLALREVAAKLSSTARILWELLTDRELLAALRTATIEPITAGELDELVRWSAAQIEEPPESEYVDADPEAATPIDGKPLGESDSDEAGARGKLDVEDDVLLLRLHQILFGQLPRADGEALEYDHIAVDEAQDLSVIEVALLWNLCGSRRSMTIAGDVAQRVIFDNGFRGWSELLADVGVPEAIGEIRPLRLAYRSTEPVMRFGRAVLGPLLTEQSESDAEARPGADVELHAFSDMGQAVAFVGDALRSLLNREPSAAVALLTRHSGQADAWYAALGRAEVPMLRRVRRQDFSFTAGVDVCEISQVKGLEFDYVLVCDVNESSFPATVESRHLLHIAATRATHQLWLVSTAAVPALLREAGYRGEEEAEVEAIEAGEASA